MAFKVKFLHVQSRYISTYIRISSNAKDKVSQFSQWIDQLMKIHFYYFNTILDISAIPEILLKLTNLLKILRYSAKQQYVDILFTTLSQVVHLLNLLSAYMSNEIEINIPPNTRRLKKYCILLKRAAACVVGGIIGVGCVYIAHTYIQYTYRHL